MKIDSIQTGLSKIWLSLIFLLTVALGLFWTGYNTLEERVITVRYFLFALTALVAFITPYVLFPDKNISILQLGNVSGSDIRKYLLEKIWRLFWPVYVLLTMLLFGDLLHPLENVIDKIVYVFSSFLLFSGLLLFSVLRYLRSGESSQFWKESEKGRRLRENLANYFKYPLDPGTLPSLLNTVLVFVVGSAVLVVGAVVHQYFSLFAELVLYLIFFVVGFSLFISKSDLIVRSFYATDAFFHEFFGVSLKGEEKGIKREVDQLWWVPARLKMHVWQFLLQLDRKIPAGRAVAAGHLAVWFIAYQRPEPQFLVIIWILFAIFHQLFTLLSLQQEMAPYWILNWVDKPWVWTLSRFWMQLRWVLPLLLSMNVQYFIFGLPGIYDQVVVIIIFLISSLLTSLFGTMKLKQVLNT